MLLLLLVVGLEVYEPQRPAAKSASATAQRVGAEALERAFAERRSDVQVEVRGALERTLPDDDEGSRHQRFVLRLESGHTVLVSHNLDLAPRIDGLRRGDTVVVSGEYEWNERGGVIHWTHHDPAGRHPGGWVESGGRRYQ